MMHVQMGAETGQGLGQFRTGGLLCADGHVLLPESSGQ